MELLYRGFDGLDISFQAQVPGDLCRELEEAKAAAQERHSDILLSWKGIRLLVAESGARGGYAFRASAGELGATWFFKRPNARDPWGVRVSCGSFQLALNGLAKTRTSLLDTLDALGLAVANGQESIGRIDYALDFLAPDFELKPDAFVMHSNSVRSDHFENVDVSTHGTSGRTTSVTVGKMPGRQVIVYDKRAEIIAHNKQSWWIIWNATRSKNGLASLQIGNPNESRVWRVELRAGKKFLKDRWGITTWSDLLNKYGDVVAATLRAVRHTRTKLDGNRSRWPDSELWSAVKAESDGDLFELRNYADPDLVRSVQQDAFCAMLERQMDGLAVTTAAVRGIPPELLSEFARSEGKRMSERIKVDTERFIAKYESATARYDVGAT